MAHTPLGLRLFDVLNRHAQVAVVLQRQSNQALQRRVGEELQLDLQVVLLEQVERLGHVERPVADPHHGGDLHAGWGGVSRRRQAEDRARSQAGHQGGAGVFQGVKDLIEEFHLSPEQAQQFKLKLAEMQHQRSLQADDHAHQVELERMKQQNAMLLDEVRRNHEQQLKANEFDQQRQLAEVTASVEREKADWERHFKTNEVATNFDLEERKLNQAQNHHQEKIGFERQRHTDTQSMDREKQHHEVLGKVMDAETKKDAESERSKPDPEMAELVKALRESVKAMMAAKRIIKDPKTGEKRMEVVQDSA